MCLCYLFFSNRSASGNSTLTGTSSTLKSSIRVTSKSIDIQSSSLTSSSTSVAMKVLLLKGKTCVHHAVFHVQLSCLYFNNMLLNICCFSSDITADITMIQPLVNFAEEQQEPEALEVSLEHDEL